MKAKCLNCGKEVKITKLKYDDNLQDFYETCSECGASFDINFDINITFITDVNKMRDFEHLTMEEFLRFYSYMTVEEYEVTLLYLNWLKADDMDMELEEDFLEEE